jgi:hypothetical protein
MRVAPAVLVVAVVAIGAGPAMAQTDGPRVLLSVNLGLQPGSEPLADAGTFTVYDEAGALAVSGEASTGALLDIGAAYRVAGRVTAGLSYQRSSSANAWELSGLAPHPLFFNQPRPFTATVDDVERSENAFHFSIGYLLQATDRLDLHIYGGPTLFGLSQQVVAGVTVNEGSSPFTTVTVTPTIETREENAWGAHLGFDAAYIVAANGSSSFGLGAFVRYAAASTDIPIVSGAVETDLGGYQFGAGARFRF